MSGGGGGGGGKREATLSNNCLPPARFISVVLLFFRLQQFQPMGSSPSNNPISVIKRFVEITYFSTTYCLCFAFWHITSIAF